MSWPGCRVLIRKNKGLEFRGLFQMKPSIWPTATPQAPAHGWVPDESETEMTEHTYTREDMARAWEEGAQAGWGATSDGWNAETAGEWTVEPSTPFRVANQETPNPYKEEDPS